MDYATQKRYPKNSAHYLNKVERLPSKSFRALIEWPYSGLQSISRRKAELGFDRDLIEYSDCSESQMNADLSDPKALSDRSISCAFPNRAVYEWIRGRRHDARIQPAQGAPGTKLTPDIVLTA